MQPLIKSTAPCRDSAKRLCSHTPATTNPASGSATESPNCVSQTSRLAVRAHCFMRPTVLSRTLKDGDVLVFLSDGITAAFGSSADIAEFLGTLRLTNPQAVADELLAGALQRTGGAAPDDMTVLAVRLLRTAESDT